MQEFELTMSAPLLGNYGEWVALSFCEYCAWNMTCTMSAPHLAIMGNGSILRNIYDENFVLHQIDFSQRRKKGDESFSPCIASYSYQGLLG